MIHQCMQLLFNQSWSHVISRLADSSKIQIALKYLKKSTGANEVKIIDYVTKCEIMPMENDAIDAKDIGYYDELAMRMKLLNIAQQGKYK